MSGALPMRVISPFMGRRSSGPANETSHAVAAAGLFGEATGWAWPAMGAVEAAVGRGVTFVSMASRVTPIPPNNGVSKLNRIAPNRAARPDRSIPAAAVPRTTAITGNVSCPESAVSRS